MNLLNAKLPNETGIDPKEQMNNIVEGIDSILPMYKYAASLNGPLVDISADDTEQQARRKLQWWHESHEAAVLKNTLLSGVLGLVVGGRIKTGKFFCPSFLSAAPWQAASFFFIGAGFMATHNAIQLPNPYTRREFHKKIRVAENERAELLFKVVRREIDQRANLEFADRVR